METLTALRARPRGGYPGAYKSFGSGGGFVSFVSDHSSLQWRIMNNYGFNSTMEKRRLEKTSPTMEPPNTSRPGTRDPIPRKISESGTRAQKKSRH